MSVHSAKGLEFPVVVLADLTCNETAQSARRFVDPERGLCAQMLAGCAPRELLEHATEERRRDTEEATRVLYVAATRARDLLVVPVVGDERYDGWLAKLSPALYPDALTARKPADSRAAGCPEFRASLCGIRPSNARVKGKGIAPGIHRPEAGEHRVVWWDPSILTLDARETMGLRQSKLLEADGLDGRSARGKDEYDAWRVAHSSLIAAGGRPTIRVVSATEHAHCDPLTNVETSAKIELIEVPRIASRPHGARFGTLTHALLARVTLQAPDDQIRATARFYGRMLGASDAEIEAAAITAAATLASEVMRRAAVASELRRESALAMTLDSGMLVEGIADLAFQEIQASGEPIWTVVDFKTDAYIDGHLNEYRTQLALYMRAIERATNLPTQGILLWI